jgi:hypothetical protein
VQLIPVNIQGHLDPYLILVATKLIRCIDDAASEEVLYWRPEDGRPEKVGQHREMYTAYIQTPPRWATPGFSAPGAGPSPSSFLRTSSRPWSESKPPA